MISVFLSHSSADNNLARQIAHDLKNHSIKVWFDEWEILVGHSIAQKINKGLQESNFVAVLLTAHSVESGWVGKEWQSKIWEEAQQKKVKVLPLLGGECKIPPLLSDKRYANFILNYDEGLKNLIKAIYNHSGISSPVSDYESPIVPERIIKFSIGGLPFPSFFPSVSGAAKNFYSPLQHLKIIMAAKHPLFLISAYDISKASRQDRLNMQKYIEKASEQGQIVLLDSGQYEKKWLRAKSWPMSKFYEIVRSTSCHLAFCFDTPNPKGNVDEIVSNICSTVANCQNKGDMKSIYPIVHAQSSEDFREISTKLAIKLNPPLIAIPERELGDGVLNIAKNIYSIRQSLNSIGQYYPLHILGTGNPLSLLIYSIVGADSFDGIDWCQTVVDHSTGLLYHNLQLDFFKDQTTYGIQENLPYLARVLAHNLLFYYKWMERIQIQIKEKTIGQMLEEFLPSHIANEVTDFISD